MMKRLLIFLLTLCTAIGLSACTLLSRETDLATNSEKVFINGKVENGLTYYNLSTLPGAVGVGTDYDAYSPEYGYTEEMLEGQGISKEKLDNYLQISGKDLIIVPKNESLGAPKFEVSIRVKSNKDYGIVNLKSLNEAMFKEFADALVQSFALDGNAIPYTVYKNDSAKYIVFDSSAPNWQRRYATIINGKMVYFIVASEENSLSKEQEAAARAIIDTLQY